MSKEGVSFKNRDRFIQLGIAISTLRKLRGMSQDQLAEKANMSRSHLSAIEAPNMIRSFSLETLFNLADALMITPCHRCPPVRRAPVVAPCNRGSIPAPWGDSVLCATL